jgi:hypothetical protein
MAVSSDGRLLASAGYDTITLWCLETASAVTILDVHPDISMGNLGRPLLADILRRATTLMLELEPRQPQTVVFHALNSYRPPAFVLGKWLVCGHQRAIRLPRQYSALHLAACKGVVAMGHPKGRVTVIGLDDSSLPEGPSTAQPSYFVRCRPLPKRHLSDGLLVPHLEGIAAPPFFAYPRRSPSAVLDAVSGPKASPYPAHPSNRPSCAPELLFELEGSTPPPAPPPVRPSFGRTVLAGCAVSVLTLFGLGVLMVTS